ncbi:lytic transglycosylase domain-containing protein [Streptomyces clavifer]|uniref:lytic transglycosylase domain-containing protein n=1 Tax=Streptomyces TaxID=1883 RepID=UPI0006F63732|nr:MULTISPECIES: lytic transglycosylase domain-containing protein [unclassified Streptomyces]KQX79538.1 lytic transglycosylase [Streptomyces sp. Root1319]KQZ20946.1 lytic transglycosylase [Streptomyces sp. Root55]
MAAQFGRRLRRGATTTAVAAAAVAALSASQAPAAPLAGSTAGGDPAAAGTTPSGDSAATGNSPYHTDLPPLTTPNKPGSSVNLPVTGSAEAGIPATILAAYKKAEQDLASTDAACRLPWQLLAAIGKVESGQARGGKVDDNGTTFSPILGPALNGQGFALIRDSDGGAYDGDSTHDRAVGPMQFIPQTWATWGQDGNGDGRKDPNNIYDAALAAGRYLCAGTRDLGTAADLDRAVLSYNRSREYLRTVRSWFDFYQRGTHEVPDGTGVLPAGPGSGSSGPSPVPTPTPPSGGGATPSPDPTPPKPPAKPPVKPPTTPPTKPPTTPPTKPPTTPPAPSDTFGGIENAGTGTLSATAGEAFAERVRVRAKNTAGAPLAKISVTFAITGDTDARFAGGRTTVTLSTGADGTATAPVLTAGEKTGGFKVTAVAGTAKPRTLTYAAAVTARQADALTRTDDKALSTVAGTEFADTVEVRATYKGTGLADTAVTATMITEGDEPAENDKGPYFEDAAGEPVRTLTGLRTGADGVLKLPKIFADGAAGTYTLRLTTASGVTLDVELTVEAAPAA